MFMEKKYLSCILIKNQPGMLGKIATILGENNINIDQISLSIINKEETIQKIVAYTSGINSEEIINKIIKKIPGVLEVSTFEKKENIIEKEVCLIRIENLNPKIVQVVELITKFCGRVVHMDNKSSVYEVIESTYLIDNLVRDIFDLTSDIKISRSPVVISTADKF